jgi:hypothetical protein
MDGDYGAISHSVAMKPSDAAFWMLLDDKTSVPVVHRDGCYICEDPEFAAMGLPLCFPCPACVRKQQVCGACGGSGGPPGKTPCTGCLATGVLGAMGHIAADDTTCDDCEYEHGPDDYDEAGLITGVPRERALAIKNMRRGRAS